MKRYLIPITLLTLLVLSGCRVASYFSQGNEDDALGQYEKAISDYSEAIRLQPDDVAAHFIRGLAYTQLDRYAEAITALETALELAQAAGNDGLATTIEETLEAVRPP